MRRVIRSIAVLAILMTGMLIIGQPAVYGGAEDGTPVAAGHPLVGTWVVTETSPPAGGPPPVTAVATFFADGNALVTGFGDGQRPLQGVWSAAGERGVTFTVVGLVVGGGGETDGSLRRIRASVEVGAAGDAFTAAYTFETLNPDGSVGFTYMGPLAGTRVTAEPADALATPAAGTPVARASAP